MERINFLLLNIKHLVNVSLLSNISLVSNYLYHQISFFCNDAKKIYSKKNEVKKIKALADRESHIDLETMCDYEKTDFLSPIRSILCKSIQSKRNFRGILDSSEYVKNLKNLIDVESINSK